MSSMPELPERINFWPYVHSTGYTIEMFQSYGDARAAHARKLLLTEIFDDLDSSEKLTDDLTDIEKIRNILNYLPETDVFTWKFRRGNRSAGDIAGCVLAQGYRVIKIFKHMHQAHVVAWALVHGYWPNDEIDHINGVRDDNRISNLREATTSQNSQNKTKALPNNKSGLMGAHLMARSGKWVASIVVDHKKIHLGTYSTPNEAHESYVKAKRKLHSFNTI